MAINAAGIVMGAQGLFLLGNGVYLLAFPDRPASDPNGPFYNTPVSVIRAFSTTSFSIGAFYLQAVYQRNRSVTALSVVGRAMAVGVFGFMCGEGAWRKVAAFEGAMGVLLALSLFV
ncbi:hypothetical protein PV08_07302 [Exophiala spinifera]|uniref:Uncharacterized protein n=1 Tax=Exophiala spinifera TaxID=91928 RepID=A0A0D2B6N7_9EURO|nr:uncharacterized protein PV08_07302 [Exophiala spinifera]KIW14518.1 hypothetical protein PV08_07302 [Exophiala spinifera]